LQRLPIHKKATTWTRAMVLRVLWSGWAASVSVVLLATIAVEAVPHARGISLFPQLRYAVITPACVLVAVAAVSTPPCTGIINRVLGDTLERDGKRLKLLTEALGEGRLSRPQAELRCSALASCAIANGAARFACTQRSTASTSGVARARCRSPLHGRCMARPRAGLLRSVQRREGRVECTERGLSVLRSTTTGQLWMGRDGGEEWSCLFDSLPPIYNVKVAVV
jgi:hypothetical protein